MSSNDDHIVLWWSILNKLFAEMFFKSVGCMALQTITFKLERNTSYAYGRPNEFKLIKIS